MDEVGLLEYEYGLATHDSVLHKSFHSFCIDLSRVFLIHQI